MRMWLLLMFLLVGPAWGDYFHSAEYNEAEQAFRAQDYLRAKELGQKMLAADPGSFEGAAVLGEVYLWGEADLQQAYRYLSRARASLEAQFPPPLDAQQPRALHRQILKNLRKVSFELERYRQTLTIIEAHDQHYSPKLNHHSGWALMKLGRLREAEQLMTELASELDDRERGKVVVLDTLGQLAFEAGDLEEASQYYEAARQLIKKNGWQMDPVFFANAGGLARDLLDFSKAEARLLEASQRFSSYSFASPWGQLAELYAGQGRLLEAVDAIKREQQWHTSTNPVVLHQKRAEVLSRSALVLLACGYAESATRVLDRVLAAPDRNAVSSTSASVTRARQLFLLSESLRMLHQQRLEEASWGQQASAWEIWGLMLRSRFAGQQMAVLMARDASLQQQLQPYGPGSVDCPWMACELVRVWGAGPVAATVASMLPQIEARRKAYLLSYLQPAEALPMLDPAEVLLKAQLLARTDRLQEALQLDPLVCRRLGMSLPTRVDDPRVAAKLYASPRFHRGDAFQVQLGEGLSGRLVGAEGSVLAEVGPQPSAAEFSRQLHRSAFRPNLGLDEAQVIALEGGDLTGQAFSKRLEDLLVEGQDFDLSWPEGF